MTVTIRAEPRVRGGLRHTSTRRAQSLRARPAFSLVDLLVSIFVIAVLISLLLPSLTSMQESARRVRCGSQLHHIGLALTMYADDHKGYLPASELTGEDPLGQDPMHMMVVHQGEHVHDWDGLGLLTDDLDYLSHPHALYCPSHSGQHSFDVYERAWVGMDSEIVCNYHYRVGGEVDIALEALDGDVTLVSDGLRTKADYNHRVGGNVLKANLSVEWYNDNGGEVLALLPSRDSDVHPGFGVGQTIWTALDQGVTPSEALGPGNEFPTQFLVAPSDDSATKASIQGAFR